MEKAPLGRQNALNPAEEANCVCWFKERIALRSAPCIWGRRRCCTAISSHGDSATHFASPSGQSGLASTPTGSQVWTWKEDAVNEPAIAPGIDSLPPCNQQPNERLIDQSAR